MTLPSSTMTLPGGPAPSPLPPPLPPPPSRRGWGSSLLVAVLAIAVGLAFADTSVVVLALPDLYREFHTSIVSVSWVLTAYAAVLALAALLVGLFGSRARAGMLTVTGVLVFAGSCLVVGLAGSFGVVIAARGAQGIGAALLLGGSIPVLAALAKSEAAGRALWGWAATIGVVVGPFLGGLATQLLDWRAIFLIQAPVVALGLLVILAPPARRVRATPPTVRSGASRPLVANLSYALLFAALVGVLFLSVLLVVEVWQFTPIAGALLVTTLPLGTLVARVIGARLGTTAAVLAGTVLLVGGLVGLGLLPGSAAAHAAGALGCCGLGFGLIAGVLGPVAVPATAGAVRAAGFTVAARHAGIVLGLVVLAPVLAGSLTHAAEQAELVATRTMLDARVPATEKVPLALDLRDTIEQAPDGHVPDLDAVFRAHGAGKDGPMTVLRDDLVGSVEDALTRAFRSSFFLAAALAAAAAIPALVATHGTRRRATATSTVALVVVTALGATVLAVGEVKAGAWDRGTYTTANACTASPDPYPVGGLDGWAQNAALGALNGAACELGVSREELVLSLDQKAGVSTIHWDKPTIEKAVRSGLVRSIDDMKRRGSLASPVAWVLEQVAKRAPVSWVLDRLGVHPS